MTKATKKVKAKTMYEAHRIAMAVAFNSGRSIETREMFGRFLVIRNFERVVAIISIQ